MRYLQVLSGHVRRRMPGKGRLLLSRARRLGIVEGLRQRLRRFGRGRGEGPVTMRNVVRAVLLAALAAAWLGLPPAKEAGAHSIPSGTVSASSGVITSSDPSACTVQAASPPRGRRAMNKGKTLAQSVDAWLFDARCDGGANNFEIRVHEDFTETDAASAAEKYGKDVGRLPKVLRTGIGTATGVRILSIHKGNQSWFVSRWSGHIRIYTERRSSTYHEEVMVHEAAHVSLDNRVISDPKWLAAQKADGAYISKYAGSYPQREDVAESFLAYLAARYLPSRIGKSWETTILQTIPNRIAYFDALLSAGDMKPFVSTAPRVARGEVAADNPVTLSVSGNGAISEGDAALTVTATLGTANATGAALAIPVRVRKAGTTATAGDDYTLAGTISIADGASSGTTAFAVVDDSEDEPDETVVVELGSPLPAGLAAGKTDHVTIAISDNDNPVSLSVSANGAISEGDAALTITATLGRANAAGAALAIPVRVRKAGTTATAGDYTLASTISIADGASSGTTAFAVVDDNESEPGETVVVELGSPLPAGLAAGETDHVTIAISDNDNPVTLSVSANGAISEGDAALTVTATLGRANATGAALAIPVQVRAAGTTATAGDYTLASTISIADGASSGTTAFAVVDDSDDEPGETVVVELGSPLPSGLAAGKTDHATIAIADNDATTVTLTVPDAAAAEGDAADMAQIALTLNRGLAKGESLAVPLRFAGGAAGTDFTLAAPNPLPAGVTFSGTTVTFAGPASGESAASVTLTLGALADADTADRTVTVSIPSSSTGSAPKLTAAGLGGGAAGTRTGNGQIVLEDVTPEVSISRGSGGTEGEAVEFTLTATPPPAGPLAVGVTVSTDGDFGIAAGSRTVTIPAGGSAVLTLPTTNDDADEPDGSVTAALEAGDGYTPGALNSLTLDVIDDDEPAPVPATAGLTVSLSAEHGSIAEAKGETKFTIALSRALGSGEAAVVPFTVTGAKPYKHWNIGFRSGDNGPGVARTATGRHSEVTFAEGGQTAVLVLSALANDDDRDRIVRIAFGTGDRAPGATGVAGGIAPAGKALAVAIVDDDKPGLTVSLAAKRTSIAEAGGKTRFTIALSRALGSGEAAVVPFTVTGGKPYEHWNIWFRSGASGPGVARTATGRHSEVTFTEGGQTAVLALSAVANDDDRDRTVRIAFGTGDRAPVATGVAGGLAPAGKAIAVAIVDDELSEPEGRQDPEPVPVLTLAGGGAVVEGASAGFTLTAAPPPASDLAVTLRIAQTGVVAAALALGERTVTVPSGTASLAVPVATAGDAADEPDGAVTATVVAVGDAPVGSGASATVSVTDDDATAVTLSAPSGDIAEADGRKTLTVTLGRALVAGERLAVPLVLGGAAARGGDYTLSAPDTKPRGVSYAHLAGTDPASPPTLTFTGPSASSATLVLTARADTSDEGAGEGVTVAPGTLAPAGLGGGARGAGSASFAIVEPAPEVSIAAQAASVTEGGNAVFTVSASRAPGADLTVRLTVSEAAGGDFVAADDEGAARVTIAKGATGAAFSVATANDAADEPDGAVTVTVAADGESDARYRVAPAPNDAASVAVADDDAPAPALSVGDATVKEGAGLMWFTIRLGAPLKHTVSVSYRTRESTPVSAQQGRDYLAASWNLDFRAGETEKRVWVLVYDDSHDEDPETFEFVLWSASGAPIADAVGVGTIVNDDPMPAAWLARFGRTVAEQALDGIAGRMAAPRMAGMQGALAGQALGFGPDASGGNAAPGHARGGTAVPDGTGAQALSDIAQAFGSRSGAGGEGSWGAGPRDGVTGSVQDRAMTMRDIVLGSSFSLTGAADASGGSMAFWGRAAQGSFDGREGTFSLDGAVTTGMLGADYARGKWLAGLALMQSAGEGDYIDAGSSDACPEGMSARTRVLCEGAVREGDGSVEASLTAAVPYAALKVSERLKLWGALGHGSGDVTLKTALGGSYSSDTTWSMAAAGLRGDLLAPPAEGSGPALALTSDALWTRTSSEKTRDLAASESDATRLRLGLEGSWKAALADGGHVMPKLELGMRHDGGDAETGLGVELGGGVTWVDPGLGLSLDVSGRTLVAHGNDDLKDRGYAAALAFDPDPATQRGLSLGLRQDRGGQAAGGLDALFAPGPLEDRTGSGATSRWSMEAAYGFPILGGRFTGSPHLGLGLATGARDYSLGWRLTPEAANAPDLSFGLLATRRESDGAAPEHSVGGEIAVRW